MSDLNKLIRKLSDPEFRRAFDDSQHEALIDFDLTQKQIDAVASRDREQVLLSIANAPETGTPAPGTPPSKETVDITMSLINMNEGFFSPVIKDNKADLKEQRGELIIVGSGIVGDAHLTIESKKEIELSDVVYYCVADKFTEELVIELTGQKAISLHDLYRPEKLRRQTYHEMAEQLLSDVRNGNRVCGVFYGHPGVFAYPTHQAIRLARAEGYQAKMLPAVSAIDCLFCDLGIDPAVHGCQILEATSVVLQKRLLDRTMTVILLQIGNVGNFGFGTQNTGLHVLVAYLISIYGENYKVTIYEAAQFSIVMPRVKCIRLSELKKDDVSGISTMVIRLRKNQKSTSKYFLSSAWN